MTLDEIKRGADSNVKPLQRQNDTMGVQLDLVQYGSGAEGSRDLLTELGKDPGRPSPAGRPSRESIQLDSMHKDVDHVFNTVHHLKDSNNTVVEDYASFKNDLIKEVNEHEEQLFHLSTQLVEATMYCGKQVGVAAPDANSIQHVFDGKINRLESLLNNLSLSPPNLHHTARGGPAPAYPGQMASAQWNLPQPEHPLRRAEPKPSDWLSGLAASNGHRHAGRPALSICGSGRPKHDCKDDTTPLATPQQPFDKSKLYLGKKPPAGMTLFNGKRESLSAFHDRVRDHCGCANSGWKPPLDSIKARRDRR